MYSTFSGGAGADRLWLRSGTGTERETAATIPRLDHPNTECRSVHWSSEPW